MDSEKVTKILTNKKVETHYYTQLFIDNKYVDSVAKTTIPVLNPCTEAVICNVQEGRQEDIDLAVEAAKRAFPIWSSVSIDRRAKLFFNLADKLEEHVHEFSFLESLDNGKVYNDAVEDIEEVVRVIRYYGGWSDKLTGRTYTSFDDYTISSRRVPYGTVGLISPWNYPLMMCAWKLFPALAAGNTVVLKPSEETPLTILKLCSYIREVGFPSGVVNVVPGYGHLAGDRLTSHKDVSKISFTGSTGVGRLVLKNSSTSNLKNVTLELGGKSPVVVCDDADLDLASFWVMEGAFRNTSQNCCGGTRIYVQEGIYDAFVKKLLDRVKGIKQGDPFEEGNYYGPVINERQFKNVLKYIEHGLETEKLNKVCGGKRLFEKGYYIEPTIFTQVPDSSKLAREEIFGPVLVLMTPFKTIQEAVKRANDSDYGLAAGVFSKDTAACEYFVRGVNAGTVWVNNYNITPFYVPFGGMKQSGFGRDNAEEAIHEYTTIKSVYYKEDLNKFK